jgi:type I restriction enzyme S subunit
MIDEVSDTLGRHLVKRLGSVCSLKSGEGITAARIDDHSKYPCHGGDGLRGFTSSFSHDGHYALIGRRGALCGNVVAVNGRFFASEHALVVTPAGEAHIGWLAFVVGDMNLNRYSESSAQRGPSAAKLLVIEILVPPTKAEQTAITAVLSDMDAELAALEQRREKTRALKQGMMQELPTGRTRPA